MTDLLKYYLHLKQQMLCLTEEKIVNHYKNSDEFFGFFYQLCGFTSFDDFLFSDGKMLIDKCYSIIRLYRDHHRGNSEVYNGCNEAIVTLNEVFLNLDSSFYGRAKNNYLERSCSIRGLDCKRSKRVTPELLREYMEDDFNIFEIIDQCVAGEFDDENSSFSELSALERLRKIPLKNLAVTGYSDQDTYDFIVSDSFLSTVNYLLFNCYEFLMEKGEDHLSVIEELTKKAWKERRQMQKDPSLKAGLAMPMDDYYLDWSNQTQENIAKFQEIFFPESTSKKSKEEKLSFRKKFRLFSNSKKAKEKE